jgi:hypothetical protein
MTVEPGITYVCVDCELSFVEETCWQCNKEGIELVKIEGSLRYEFNFQNACRQLPSDYSSSAEE